MYNSFFVPLIVPPFASRLLIGGNAQIFAQAGDEITRNRRFDVQTRLGHHLRRMKGGIGNANLNSSYSTVPEISVIVPPCSVSPPTETTHETFFWFVDSFNADSFLTSPPRLPASSQRSRRLCPFRRAPIHFPRRRSHNPRAIPAKRAMDDRASLARSAVVRSND